jgi:DNA primase
MLNKKKAYTFFLQEYYLSTPSSQNWYAFDCPVCGGKGKAAVKFEYEIVKCWKNCFKESIIDYIQAVKNLASRHAVYELLDSLPETDLALEELGAITTHSNTKELTGISLPYGFTPLLGEVTLLRTRIKNYLYQRGFQVDQLNAKGFGYCNDTPKEEGVQNFFGRLIIPIKKDGVLVYFLARDIIGNAEKYLNPDTAQFNLAYGKSDVLYNQDILHTCEKVYITEGWACAETMQTGVAHLGTLMSSQQVNLIATSSVEECVIIPDVGYYKEGLINAEKLLKVGKKVKVLNYEKLGYTDPKNKTANDVNSIGYLPTRTLESITDYLTYEEAITTLLTKSHGIGL